MSRLRPHRLVLGLIALLAIGWAQTFGLHRGWICDCGGVEYVTQVDHCHGPHSEACHDEENADHSIPHDHEGDDGDTHQHAAVVDSLVAKQQNDFAFSIAAPVKVLSVLDAWESLVQAPCEVEHLAETPPPRAGPAREWPLILAQTIALRI
ncbi:MAG: hypothetical protein ACO1TE_29745 [Prosthecobacter sp.]